MSQVCVLNRKKYEPKVATLHFTGLPFIIITSMKNVQKHTEGYIITVPNIHSDCIYSVTLRNYQHR